MAIPSVVQGTVEFAGKVFEVDSPRGLTWLESVTSFRYEPTGGNKSYTVRKESGKGGNYWYGYRKMSGKLHKKYIGKSSEISTAKLEEIAEALNTPPQSRVTDKVTQVTEIGDSVVTDKVTDRVTADRLTALELQVQALQESLEALRGELRGKSELGNSEELPIVTDTELQTTICNLQAENEALKADYAKLLESSTVVTNKLREEVREVRSQLEQERADREGLQKDFNELNEKYLSGAFVAEALENKNSVAASELPEAADLLNQLKAKRKKSTVSLADIEVILGMIEES
jgi:chromosome segregation ATPase